jgi:predicted ATPase/DNA-binding CsgD family transcriptional regulator
VTQRVTSSRFVGRRTELAELDRALAGTVPEELPTIYFVAGESGVGKTRLLRELIGKAEADGYRVLGGTCIELGEDELPYAPLVAALRPLHRTCEPILDELSEGTRSELARLNPEIGEPSTEPEAERGEAQRRLFDAFLELVSRLGEEGPVLLWIEDIHWADRSTRSFLRFIAASLAEERVLVVATYRADELHRRHPVRPLLAELERTPRARRIELARFDRDEVADQLADILGSVPVDDVVERLYGRSEGNPLFTEELLAAGVDGRGSLPPSLREALRLRVERLSPLSQRTLRLLAVAGRARQELLAEAESSDSAELSAAMREAVEAQIVVALDSGRFGFRHALLREVLYDDLLPGERAELHLALAGALERMPADGDSAWSATAVAHHYYSAGDQPRALKAALEASSAVRGLHAYGEAAGLLDRALELWPRVPEPEEVTGIDEGELLTRAARVHYLAGEDAVGGALYERALEAVGDDPDPERLASLLTALATCQWSLGQAERSRATQGRGLELLAGRADSPARARLLAQQVRFLLLQGRYREVCEAAPDALEAAQRLGLDSERAGILNRLGCALVALGREDEGRERLAEAIEVAEGTGFSDDLATVYLNFADSLHLAGHSAEARELATVGVDRVEGMTSVSSGGSTRSLRFIRLNLAEIHFDLGEWERADEDLRAAGHGVQGVAHAHMKLRRAQLALARGDTEEAATALERADELLSDALEPQYIALLASMQAELASRGGDLESARAAADRGVDRIQFCSEDGIRIAIASAAGLAVEAEIAVRARDLGDAEEEREAVERARSLCELVRAAAEESDGRPVESAHRLLAEAELARAEGDDDPALWSAAAAAWQDLERPYPAAIARWRQAQASLGRGDRDAATASLTDAGAVAERLGATWLAGEVDGLATRARLSLRPAAASEPEPEPDEVPFGLTPRELQVLTLVAAGATNREIGERLYMAEKTASVHVSRILSKLDVRGRTEAAAVAHRHGIGVE